MSDQVSFGYEDVDPQEKTRRVGEVFSGVAKKYDIMAAGRANNFYWALVVTPPWFVGYTFLPMALRSLIASARSARA